MSTNTTRTIRICIVGMGRHGRGCFLALQWLAKSGLLGDIKLEISFCSSNAQVRSGNWKDLRTPNLGIPFPKDGIVDLKGVEIFKEPENVVADLVWICLPTSEHVRIAKYYLKKGIHVLLEKPVALNLADAQSLLAAARESKAILLVAHELVYFLDFAKLFEVLWGSETVTDLRLLRQISTGDETAGAHNVDKFGGPVIDLHVHCNHLLALALGMPDSVQVQGIGDLSADYLAAGTTCYGYEGRRVTSTWGVSDEADFNFRHGYQVRFASGRQSHYEFNVFGNGTNCFSMPPVTYYGIGGNGANPVCAGLETTAEENVPDGLGPLVRELQEAIATIVEGRGHQWINADSSWKSRSPLCPTLAVNSLKMCLAEKESWRTGKRVLLSDM